MDFFINKNATLPVLSLELIQDGRYDQTEFYNKLQNSNIYFTMTNIDTGVRKIGKKLTSALSSETCDTCETCITDRYYIAYRFTQRDTSIPGVYIGQFTIEFLDGSGTLIVPIQEELRVNIIEGSIKK